MGPGRGQSRALIEPPGLPFGRAIGVPFGYFQGPAMGLSRGQNSALIDLSESLWGGYRGPCYVGLVGAYWDHKQLTHLGSCKPFHGP